MIKQYGTQEYIDHEEMPSLTKKDGYKQAKKLIAKGYKLENGPKENILNHLLETGTYTDEDGDVYTFEEYAEGCYFSKNSSYYVCERGVAGASEEDTVEILNLMKNNGYVLTVNGFDYKLILVNDELFIPFKFMDYILKDSESAVTELDNIEEADGFTEVDYRKFLKSLWKAGCKLGPNTYEKYKDMIDVLLNKEVPTEDLVAFCITEGGGAYSGGAIGRFGMVMEGYKFKIICYTSCD